ncbi:TraR/DksA C4-type zinc finger protein [Thermoanaerobacterium sp. RBIITD]|uniref:TraR/DksA C4-type zinc finger protein n=1 Tax=Thermoanaerobacterium sp. RBIITD TaxID=1550240 RepID=UPI000BB72CA0|nr:TraR/DksA C4-type zinc finger protein [Thermoanaerobacterium sp. RBIITD]SNX55288.1 transcriptional regulator, TraR/DksA family [Thermoanaerobacterium sp. RBIITD]
MNNEKLEYFRQKLIKERDNILNILNEMDDNDGTGRMAEREYYQELSLADNHPADIGSEVYEIEKNYALKDNEQHVLRQIDDALERMQTGQFGNCNHCHKEIELDRLEAIPYASLCSECAKNNDLKLSDLRYSRSNEERSIKYPFGWGYMDSKDENQFDAEDAYQAVARYNKTKAGIDNYDDDYDDYNSGYVEETDKLSNEDYKKTIE